MKAPQPPDPAAFFEELSRAYTGDAYTEIDRNREFKALFLGSEQGKRVLWQIIGWGHLFREDGNTDMAREFMRKGERNLALKILSTVHVEPKQRPTVAVSRKPKQGDTDG